MKSVKCLKQPYQLQFICFPSLNSCKSHSPTEAK